MTIQAPIPKARMLASRTPVQTLPLLQYSTAPITPPPEPQAGLVHRSHHDDICNSSNAISWESEQTPPSSCKRRKSSTETHDGIGDRTYDSLEVQFYHATPKLSKKVPVLWVNGIHMLLKETPHWADWSTNLKQRGIYQALRDDMTAKKFLTTDDPENFAQAHLAIVLKTGVPRIGTSPTEYTAAQMHVLKLLCKYAHNTSQLKTDTNVNRRLAQFQGLVFLSACVVLRECGFREEHICEVTRRALGKMTDDHCRRLMRVAIWKNRILSFFESLGWKRLGIELLLLCESSQIYPYPRRD